MTFCDKEMYWLAKLRFDTVKRESSKVKKKVIKVVGKFNTKYSREKEMVQNAYCASSSSQIY